MEMQFVSRWNSWPSEAQPSIFMSFGAFDPCAHGLLPNGELRLLRPRKNEPNRFRLRSLFSPYCLSPQNGPSTSSLTAQFNLPNLYWDLVKLRRSPDPVLRADDR